MRVFRGQNLDELGSNAGALFENERVSRPGSGHFLGAVPVLLLLVWFQL